ncbi:hypothetical protein MMC24_005884 [Lignoscripta atroalba]|nr:hypothetical protein [Lignoscripta atroalba]
MFKPAVFLAAALIATLTHAAPIDFPEDISNATSTLEARVDDGFMYYYGNSDCSGPGNGNWLGQPGSCHGLPGWSLKIISLPHGKATLNSGYGCNGGTSLEVTQIDVCIRNDVYNSIYTN